MTKLARTMADREERFADAYMRTLDAQAAAIEAGYSPKSARHQGHRMLQRDGVETILKAKRARLRERADVDMDAIIAELAAIAFFDPADICSDGPAGMLKKIGDMPERARRCIAGITWKKGLSLEVKIASKVAALGKLAEILQGRLGHQDLPSIQITLVERGAAVDPPAHLLVEQDGETIEVIDRQNGSNGHAG